MSKEDDYYCRCGHSMTLHLHKNGACPIAGCRCKKFEKKNTTRKTPDTAKQEKEITT